MSVNKYKISYVVNNKNFSASYSENSFGIYAKKIAEKSDNDNYKYRNYFEFNGDIVTMIIYSKKYGYHSVLFNKRHFNKIKLYRWHINKQNNTFYCNGKLNGGYKQYQFHKIIMNYNGPLQIDHIDKNGLNNLDNNLRIVTSSVNQRNTKTKNSIWTNVSIQTTRKGRKYFLVSWTTISGKAKSRQYSFNDTNFNEMKNKAIIKSIKKRAINGYTLNKDDKKFIREHNLKLISKFII